MITSIPLTPTHIDQLDLSPVQTLIESWSKSSSIAQQDPGLVFEIHYPQADESDPVEFSEMPEVRLWFLRLDTVYPWLPYILDWRSGELARYAAMLVPHQFSQREGIQYNPQALDIFIMQKVFWVRQWLLSQGIENIQKLQQMTEMFGYEIEAEFFDLI